MGKKTLELRKYSVGAPTAHPPHRVPGRSVFDTPWHDLLVDIGMAARIQPNKEGVLNADSFGASCMYVLLKISGAPQ